MKVLTIFVAAGLLLGGCASEKISACQGSHVKGCSPVVYFDFNSSVVSPYGKERLDWGYDKLIRWPGKKVLVTGYTDEVGSDSYNFRLSKRRAEAIKAYYVGRGIDPNRIDIEYKGKTELVCEDKECQDLNRRAIVKIYNPKHWWIF